MRKQGPLIRFCIILNAFIFSIYRKELDIKICKKALLSFEITDKKVSHVTFNPLFPAR